MDDIQYTIRKIPPKVDKILKRRSQIQGKSFNSTVVEALKKGAGVTNRPAGRRDLGWFFGSGGIGQAEEEAFNAQRVIDKEKWPKNAPGAGH